MKSHGVFLHFNAGQQDVYERKAKEKGFASVSEYVRSLIRIDIETPDLEIDINTLRNEYISQQRELQQLREINNALQLALVNSMGSPSHRTVTSLNVEGKTFYGKTPEELGLSSEEIDKVGREMEHNYQIHVLMEQLTNKQKEKVAKLTMRGMDELEAIKKVTE